MQHIKLWKLKIPYTVSSKGAHKILHILGLNIPYCTYQVGSKKYYQISWFRFHMSKKNTHIVSANQFHYSIRDQLDDKKITELSRKIFLEKLGYEPNFEDPKSMNEKIFWMKLHYKNPLITKCCDKFSVKGYIRDILGEGYSIPTLDSWKSADQIDFSSLPNQCVLKVNWASGYNVIIKDLASISKDEVREQIRFWMRPEQNSYFQAFNWGYKDMEPVVYAEKYIEQIDGQLFDYKFFCCNGKVRFWFIATDRYTDHILTHDFFDMDFNKLPFDYGGRAHSTRQLEKPKFYEQMIVCAEKLSEPFPFVRVDFYETANRFYIGEMTFYPGGGILPFTPREWDYKLGEYIQIPTN